MMLSYSKEKLRGGVRVILSPQQNTRAVTVLVLVGTGSKYETKRLNGVSHFLEHMFFKGTKKRPSKKEIAEVLDGVGAEFNAFTTEEVTGYYVKVERSHVYLALDVVADILHNSTFPAKEIAQEKRVIFEEINMIADDPMRQIYEHWQELLYGDQPAGWSIAGTKESVGGVARKDLLNYFDSQYRSRNMVVAVAGNFPKAEVRKRIKSFFAHTKEGDAGRQKPVPLVTQKEPKVSLVAKETGQTHILIGAHAFTLSDPRRYALAVLATILGGGMSSRLFMKVRDEKGLVYYIRTQVSSDTDSGFLATAAGVDNTRLKEALLAIMREYRLVKNKGVTALELKRAKNTLRGRMLLGLEESNEIASYLAAQEILEGKITDPEEEIKCIEKVSVADVAKVARDVFQYDKMNMVILGPQKGRKAYLDILSDI